MERDFFNFYLKNNNQLSAEKGAQVEPEPNKNEKREVTPAHLRIYGDKVIDTFCKKFSVEGMENIQKAKEENSDQKFIISAAHLNNLDIPAALKVFGKEFNIQLTGESVLLEKLKYLGHRMMINLAGRDNFTALDYIENKKNKEGTSKKYGSFNPDNFKELEEKVKEGKTPWIAGHEFSLDGKMKRANIGPVYLAIKTKSLLIPTALNISGGSVNLEGALESVKTLVDRSEAVYRIGSPLKFPDIDISPIDNYFEKRKSGEKISESEQEAFRLVHMQLRDQADIFEKSLAELLPPEKRREEKENKEK